MFEMLSTLVGISPVDENLSYLDEPASRSFFSFEYPASSLVNISISVFLLLLSDRLNIQRWKTRLPSNSPSLSTAARSATMPVAGMANTLVMNWT